MRICALALAFCLIGCGSSSELLVDVHSDLVPGEEFDRITVQVSGGFLLEVSVNRSTPSLLDQGFRLPAVPVGSGMQRVTVELENDGVTVLSRDYVLVVDRRALLDVWLIRRCRDVVCPSPGAPDRTECDNGVCVRPDCTDSSCGGGGCVRDADCEAPPVSCAEARCIEARCVTETNDALCPVGNYCDPDVGCSPITVEPDAGGLDAGGIDAPGASIDTGGPDEDVSLDTPPDVPPPPPYRVYFLAPGAASWTEVGTSGIGPSVPIRAAFALLNQGEIIALTDTETFTLRAADRTWIASASRAATFPELVGIDVFEAETLVGLNNGTIYAFAASGWAEYQWLPAEGRGMFVTTMPRASFPPAWSEPLAPPYGVLLGIFGRTSDPEDWVIESPTDTCAGLPVTGPYFPYLSWDGSSPATVRVSVLDSACFEFVSQVAPSAFAPFALPGMPDVLSVEASTYLDGLYLFTR